jgi:hypothetical protein
VRFEQTTARSRGNLVSLVDGEIVVRWGPGSQTPVARGLENWLRRQARAEIEKYLNVVTTRLRQKPRRVYVIGTADEVGKLFCRPEFVVQLAANPRAGLRASLPRHTRGGSSGGPGPLCEILADRQKPLSGNRAGEAVAQRQWTESCGQTGQHRVGWATRPTWRLRSGMSNHGHSMIPVLIGS